MTQLVSIIIPTKLDLSHHVARVKVFILKRGIKILDLEIKITHPLNIFLHLVSNKNYTFRFFANIDDLIIVVLTLPNMECRFFVYLEKTLLNVLSILQSVEKLNWCNFRLHFLDGISFVFPLLSPAYLILVLASVWLDR